MVVLVLIGIVVFAAWLVTVALFRLPRSITIWIVTGLWMLYGLYEYLMFRRVLCSGDCNIRVDLVLIYPFLLLSTIAGAARVWRSR